MCFRIFSVTPIVITVNKFIGRLSPKMVIRMESKSTLQGAVVMVYGMLLGAVLLVAVQKYVTSEKQRVLRKSYEFHNTGSLENAKAHL